MANDKGFKEEWDFLVHYKDHADDEDIEGKVIFRNEERISYLLATIQSTRKSSIQTGCKQIH